jgi:hypothetical protein
MPGELRLEVMPALAAPSLLLAFEGWNDAGESASGAVRYLVDALASAPLGAIDAESFYDFTVQRPEVRIDADGVRCIDWPDYSFRYAVVPDRCELVTGIGTEPHLRWRSFCDEVLELALRSKVRRVVLLGAFLADVLYSRPVRVSGFGSKDALPAELGIQPTGYEGPTGIVGVLGSRLIEAGLETVSLWAGLPHYIGVSPNPRGTLALVQKTCQLLDLPVDQQPLERSAAEFETRVAQLVASDPALSEYVRELKKREFAQ